MGVLSVDTYVYCSLVVSVVTCTFELWVLDFVYQAAASVVTADASRGGDVLLPCVFKRFSAKQVTMGCTVAAIACIFASALVEAVAYIVHLTHSCQKDDNVFIMSFFFYAFFQNCGYLLMLVTHFERLRLTFNDTSVKLPPSARNVLYALLLSFAVALTAFVVFRHNAPIISALSIALVALLYFASVSALIRAFFQKTIAIANERMDDDDDNHLIQTAVRLTICVTTSLLSTTLVLLLWVVIFAKCPHCLLWKFVGNTLLFFDNCLNAFCLMCTFVCAEGHFQQVFGTLHSAFMRRLSLKLESEDSLNAHNSEL